MKTEIKIINKNELKFLELNARFMGYTQYQRLVENIRRDGALTSVPFCRKEEDGKYLILSGNHRVKAAIDAGLTEIVCMVTEDELTDAQMKAIQLSHNSIVGQDDAGILKKIYDSISDVDWQKYSGLDDEQLKQLEKLAVQFVPSVNL